MINLLNRTESEAASQRILWQQCDLGGPVPTFNPDTGEPTHVGTCAYCRHKSEWLTQTSFLNCAKKHACNGGLYPFIRMDRPINDSVTISHYNPDFTRVYYNPSGVYKQVKFEGMPHHIQLYLCEYNPKPSSEGAEVPPASCNSMCWWHAWRLKNKRTVPQCAATHLCQMDGSCWIQMAPRNATLYEQFIKQL